MKQQVEAVYEQGILRPLKPLSLTETQRVFLTISDPAEGATHQDLKLIERARAEAAAMDRKPTIEEVRTVLSSIPGSLSETVISERGDY